ncbi:hypothetical protein CSUI_004961, partial [Cystoisospora suis]
MWHQSEVSDESLQSLAYDPHTPHSLFLAGLSLWRKDLRVAHHNGRSGRMQRLFPSPSLIEPTFNSYAPRLSSIFRLQGKRGGSVSAVFTAIAPHPSRCNLLATAHGPSHSLLIFDIRAMHSPLHALALQHTTPFVCLLSLSLSRSFIPTVLLSFDSSISFSIFLLYVFLSVA